MRGILAGILTLLLGVGGAAAQTPVNLALPGPWPSPC